MLLLAEGGADMSSEDADEDRLNTSFSFARPDADDARLARSESDEDDDEEEELRATSGRLSNLRTSEATRPRSTGTSSELDEDEDLLRGTSITCGESFGGIERDGDGLASDDGDRDRRSASCMFSKVSLACCSDKLEGRSMTEGAELSEELSARACSSCALVFCTCSSSELELENDDDLRKSGALITGCF
jgi:hypothetical protein